MGPLPNSKIHGCMDGLKVNADHMPQASLVLLQAVGFNTSCAAAAYAGARLTHNDFRAGGDGGGIPACSGHYESSEMTPVVALSTGWYRSVTNNEKKCPGPINICVTSTQTGKSVTVPVVDECDTTNGTCLGGDIVDGSTGVWKALGLASSAAQAEDIGTASITWSTGSC